MSKIAVIGIANLFPGSTSPEEFWQSLIKNEDCRSTATPAQMGNDPDAFLGKKGDNDKYYCKEGGYIQDFKLDPTGINLPGEEIAKLDGLFQWSLYVAREALKDSGYHGNNDILKKCGVILGNLSFPTKASNQLFLPIYHQAINEVIRELSDDENFVLPRYLDPQPVSPTNALISGMPAALISKAFSLGGVNFALDAACASSLYSVQLACQFLNSGRTDMMLAGAVSGADPVFVNMGFSIFQAYPENQISAPLDTRSQGLFAGEGAGMLALKRYDDAVRDGDKIYSVILGGGLSNDGKGQHVLSPNTKGQVTCYERAYKSAGIDSGSVDYVECHATGTPLGDKVELTSMETFFGKNPQVPSIGSVKSNLGHLLTAAGMPGMTKVMMAMDKGTIPGTINIEKPQASPKKMFTQDQIVTQNRPWPENSQNRPKRAGVSVFGFGGANAHLVFEQYSQQETSGAATPQPKNEPVAIVGMGAHFGGCESVSEFNKANYDLEQQFVDLPSTRWRGMDQASGVNAALGGSIPKGAYIKDFDLDFLHFKIPPNEDDRLIPQQLLLLKVADKAIQEAGIETGSNVAVMVAMGTELELHQFRGRGNLNIQFDDAWDHSNKTPEKDLQKELLEKTKDAIHPHAKLNQYTSSIGNIMASRVSSVWNFSGPALTISAEENSVYRAIEIGRVLLETTDVEAVVVGAIDLSGSLENVLLRNAMAKLNGGNFTLGIDENASGWQVGEGAGAIVLKRLSDAEKDNKTIYASIDGLAFADGTDKESITKASTAALSQANLVAEDVEFLELYGSGNAAEDDAEVAGLKSVYGEGEANRCAVGSVKANIGHTFSASGMASIIRTALSIHGRYIPGIPGWQAPKAHHDLENSAFYMPTVSKAWFKASDSKRAAAINGMGMDGQTCHLVLREAGDQNAARTSDYLYNCAEKLIVVKGNDAQSLIDSLEGLKTQLLTGISIDALANKAYQDSKALGETSLTLCLIALDSEQLGKEIKLAMSGIKSSSQTGKEWHSPSGSYFTSKPLGKDGKVAFVYPGAFNSYINGSKDIYQLFPELFPHIAEQSSNFPVLIGDQIFHPRSVKKLSEDELRQKSRTLTDTPIDMFENGISNAVSYTDIVKEFFELKPDACFGYSMGEVSMMYAMGVWGKTDLMSHKLRSTPVFQTRLAGPMDTLRDAWKIDKDAADGSFWVGYAVLASAEQVSKAIGDDPYVKLILINAPHEVIIAGKPENCKKVIDQLNCDFFEAALGDVIHCDLVRADYDGLSNLHTMDVSKNPKDVTFYTAVGYKPLSIRPENIANNIAEMYCNPVDFPRLVNTAYDDGVKIFLELGPRDGCSRYIDQALLDKEHLAVAINRKGAADYLSLIRAFAKLASHGVGINLDRLFRPVEPTPEKKKRELMIKVTVGAKTIQDHLLTPELKEKFKQVPESVPAPVPTPEAKPEPAVAAVAEAPVMAEAQSQAAVLAKTLEPKAAPAAATNTTTVASSNSGDGKPKLSFGNAAKGGSTTNASTTTSSSNNKSNNKKEKPMTAKALNESLQASATGTSAMSDSDGSHLEKFQDNLSKVNEAHAAFLDSRKEAMEKAAELIQLQTKALTGKGEVPMKFTVEHKASTDEVKVTTSATANVAGGALPSAGAAQPAAQVATAKAKKKAAKPKRDGQSKITQHFLERGNKYYQNKQKPRKVHDAAPLQAPRADRVPGEIWDAEDLREFAEGEIGNVFGKEFASIDNYGRRVRLPTTEYLLVTRVTELDAEINKYEPSSMTTEYDIPEDAWYSVDGQVPCAVAVESGQCDLMLISYIGIDFQNKGERIYRLLDCTLTFLDDIVVEGETLRYEININSYANNGDNLLFFFSYDCYIDDHLVLTMRNGAAGFFTDEELAVGKGVIYTKDELAAKENAEKKDFPALLPCNKMTYDYQDMLKLCAGDITGCFGDSHGQEPGCNDELVYAAPKMLMIERITEMDPKGGPYGLGLVVGEKDLHPEHWYFPCHFKDDQVMAGSLMSDGCGQILRFYSWFLGMHTKTQNARFQPLPGLPQKVRCRGQVTPQTGTLKYRMEVKELGLDPVPYAIADVEIILNGRIVVDFRDLGLILKEQDVNDYVAIEPTTATAAIAPAQTSTGPVAAEEDDLDYPDKTQSTFSPGFYPPRGHPFKPFPGNPNDNNKVPDTVPYTLYHFKEFATGRVANCFGEECAIYDDRIPPRTPNADLQLVTRVIDVDGERHNFKREHTVTSEFDVPPNAWFFKKNTHQQLMPYSIIMEIALQPCGFISAWAGTTLKYPEKDLFFRNLDGSGNLLKEIDLRGKTIVNRSTLLSTVSAGNTIIQSFKFELAVDGENFYVGTAVFGYFEKDALTHQLGIDNGQLTEAWFVDNNTPKANINFIDLTSDAVKQKFIQPKTDKPFYHLAGGQMNFIDNVQIVADGGKEGLGYVYAERTIDKDDWFFPCHFHQDPVMPGSLGVEAMFEAMQVYMLENDLGKDFKNPRFDHPQELIKWKYRGQITPINKQMSLDLHITKIEKTADYVRVIADGNLSKDKLRIYELKDLQFVLRDA